MTQGERAAKLMCSGWQTTSSLMAGHCGLTPLARLSEWRDQNCEVIQKDGYPLPVFRINGKLYEELTRDKKVTNWDGVKVKIIERRFQRVK